MNIDLINLVKLQQIDDKLSILLRIEQEGPEKMAAVDHDLKKAESKVSAALDVENEAKKRKRELEAASEDIVLKVKENQARQLKAKTNEEYRALLKEGDYLKKSGGVNDDELLELMEKLENLTAENEKLTAWLSEEREKAQKKKREIEVWLKESLKDKDSYLIERESLRKDIPEQFLALYKRVFDKKNGKAVVGIVDGICQQCHLKIPPQDFNELQTNSKIMVCQNCQRIIYWADHEDFELVATG